MGVYKVRAIVLDFFFIVSILLQTYRSRDTRILLQKHYVVASQSIIFWQPWRFNAVAHSSEA